MHCPACKHEKNTVVKKYRGDNGFVRIRQCNKCGTVWGTFEKMPAGNCPNCGEDNWTVLRVEHRGIDSRLRERQCRECGGKIVTVEKKMQGMLQIKML